jgi:hypothetical protein
MTASFHPGSPRWAGVPGPADDHASGMDFGHHPAAGTGQVHLALPARHRGDLQAGRRPCREPRPRGPAVALLSAIGLLVLLVAHPGVTPWGLALAVVDLVLTIGLGVAGNGAVMSTERDDHRYQRVGLTLGLWILTTGVRIGVALLAARTGAGPLVESTLLLSFGIGLFAQSVVLRRRARRRPPAPARGRPRTPPRAPVDTWWTRPPDRAGCVPPLPARAGRAVSRGQESPPSRAICSSYRSPR